MRADTTQRHSRLTRYARRLTVAALLPLCAVGASTQEQPGDTAATGPAQRDSIALLDGGGTAAGRAIDRVLRRPHIVMDGGGREVSVPRGRRFDSSLVILAPRATVAASVAGDVLVIGGDLFTHPGARIQGDAIAVGGGVYQSALGLVEGGVEAFRDETFVAERTATRIELAHLGRRIDYESELVTWPFGFGIRVPAYTRVDGLVLPWGPVLTAARGRLSVDPTVSYRSDLGAIDPGLRITVDADRVFFIAEGRRGTFSNDRWIRADPQNSLSTIWSGRDTRNYFRADRMEVRAGFRVHPGALVLEPYVGARNELGWATGSELSRERHPWSAFGRDSINGIYRPNPSVPRGRIVSALAGAALRWNPEDVRLRLSADLEQAWDREEQSGTAGVPFTQLTLHGTVSFPTFAGQRLTARAHAVTSSGDEKTPPPQRYAYVGGSGTVATMELLSEGGTELFHFAANYTIPIRRISLPYISSPTLTLRYMTGAAGVGELPELTQNIGARLGFRFISVEFLMDPDTREKRFGVGFAFTF